MADRVKRYNVRVSEALSARLEAIAENQGIAPSTLAAVAIGQYVSQTEAQMNLTKQLMSDPEFIRRIQENQG